MQISKLQLKSSFGIWMNSSFRMYSGEPNRETPARNQENSRASGSRGKAANSSRSKDFWKKTPWKPEKTIAMIFAKQIIDAMPQMCPDPGKIVWHVFYWTEGSTLKNFFCSELCVSNYDFKILFFRFFLQCASCTDTKTSIRS